MKRRAMTLIEVLIASAVMLIVALLITSMLGGTDRLRRHSHEHVVASTAVRSVLEHYAAYPFNSLDGMLEGHKDSDEALEMFLIALPGDLAAQTAHTLRPKAKMRFQRILPFNELGLLRVGFGWRSRDGRRGMSSSPRLVIDEKLYEPVELPQTARQLEALAAQDRARRKLENAYTGDGDIITNNDVSSKRQYVKVHRHGGHGHGHSHGHGHWHGGHNKDVDPLKENAFTRSLDANSREVKKRQRAGEQFDQIMEMLHDQYHGDDENVQVRDSIQALRRFDGIDGKENYNWDSVLDSRFDADYALDQMIDMIGNRAIPDGDYLYDFQMENTTLSAGSSGRIFLCYRLRALYSQKTYLLLKEVKTDSEGDSFNYLEGRPVVDCGDRELTNVFASGGGSAERVATKGLYGHLEATSKRVYFYRPSVDSDGEPEPMEQVISIRNFPSELDTDENNVPMPRELTRALNQSLKDLGADSVSLDARERGVDTKLELGW